MEGKVAVFSYGVLTEIIKRQISILNLPTKFIVYNYILEKSIDIAKKLNDIDVFVTSEANSVLLKPHLNKPVLAIKKSDFNIFTALLEASKYHSRVMFINLRQTNQQLEKIKELLNIEIYQETYQTSKDLYKIIKNGKKNNIKCIVGGAFACKAAEQHNIKGILPYSDKSTEETLINASELANLIKRETTEKSQLKTVLELSQQGILVVSKSGIITICNPIAQQFFGGNILVGRYVNEVLPSLKISAVFAALAAKNTQLYEIAAVKNKSIFLNLIPIVINNNIAKILITFDDVKSIQTAEHTIRKQLSPKGFVAKNNFSDITSQNSNFKKIIEIAKKYSLSNEAIIIIGETGTGKEILTQAIHNNSPRWRNPFVAINCSALSESLLESELFGYEEGAFTGAKKGGKPGLFEMAHCGTIFLDEIAEIQASTQVKLLRVIQEKEVMRIGGDKLIPVDIRIIAATNKDLSKLVAEGKFREDLFYRLNILELKLPPLRQRGDDVFWLFLKLAQNYSTPQLIAQITDQSSIFKQLLLEHSWPGNIRELENCVKKIFVLIDDDPQPSQILKLLTEYISEKNKTAAISADNSVFTSFSKPRYNNTLSKQEVYNTINKVNGNKSEAAKILGMSRTTLWRKLKKDESS